MKHSLRSVLVGGMVSLLFLAACQPAEETDGDSVAEETDTETVTEDTDAEDVAETPADTGVKGTLRAGLLLPFTGFIAGGGEDIRDGFLLHVEHASNLQLAGWDIDIILGDDASDPAVAIEVAERFIERDEVDIVVGLLLSSVGYAVAPILTESGTPTLITVAAANDLTQRAASDNIFRLIPTSSQAAYPLGEYLCTEVGHEQAAILALDYEFGWESMGGFARAFTDAGCNIVQEIYVPLDTQDWVPFVNQVSTDADVVVTTITGVDTVRFLQAYHDFGLADRIPVAGYGNVTDVSNLPQEEHQALAEGFISTLHMSEGIDSQAYVEFESAFESTYGRLPGVYGETGYAAALMLEAVLQQVDEPSPEALVAALGSSEVPESMSPRGSALRFDDRGQYFGNVYVRRMERVGDRWVNTVIETYPDVTQFWTYDPEEYLEFPTYTDLSGTWADAP